MTSETLTAEPFVSGLFFGECPRWHEGRLWYSDFFDHAVFSVSPDGERRVEVDFDGEPAGLGWLPDGRLLINSRLDRVILAASPTARSSSTATCGPGPPGTPTTWWWPPTDRRTRATSVSTSTACTTGQWTAVPSPPASLIRVDPDGTSHEAADDLHFPNGTVITEDGAHPHHRRELRRTSERVRPRRRRHADQSAGVGLPEDVAPDGMCLCADGSVWVANAPRPSASASPKAATFSSA